MEQDPQVPSEEMMVEVNVSDEVFAHHYARRDHFEKYGAYPDTPYTQRARSRLEI
jgi:hypothetical protein